MSKIRGKDTRPELILRKALWASGLRYRKHYGKEQIDIAFPHQKVALFIDGCFWHCCPIHGTIPHDNRSYWGPKLKANVKRDRRKNERLTIAGWQVIRIWEHQLNDVDAVISWVSEILIRKAAEKAYLEPTP